MTIAVRPLKFLLLTSCVMMLSGHAHAQSENEWGVMPTPDIVFDGSVLQELDPSSGQSAQAELPAVTLTPPSSLNRVATPAIGSLTLDSFDPSAPVTKKTAEIKPVITTTPAPATPAPKIEREDLPAPKAAKAAPPKEQKIVKAAPKAIPVAKPVAKLADIETPKRKPIARPGEIVAAVKDVPAPTPVLAPVAKIVVTKTEPAVAAMIEQAAPIVAAPPVVASIAAAPEPELEKSAASEARKEAVRPPRIGFSNPFVKAPKEDGKPVVFAVTEKTKTHGGLNPEQVVTAAAPAETDTTTIAALSETMQERDVEKPFAWRQDNPQAIYEDVPTPPKRPVNGLMASASFVQEARKSLVDTYTIVKREGDQMPAVPKEKVARQDLPPPRLSVADIAGDPLASRIMNMSPEDVANALNDMAPASGSASMNLSRELNTVAKPRIVREMGEWNRKTDKANQSETRTENAAPEKASLTATPQDRAPMDAHAPKKQGSKTKADGTAMVIFAAGEVTLSDEAAGKISQNVVTAMRQSPGSRVRIVAYSTAEDGKESSARRTSLSRALSVRSYLISQGIDATRMDVRAMGVPSAGDSVADKVDMILLGDEKT